MTRISTLLVANRGEIARRVIRTARGMGIRTVAVYSEPDARAPHIADADMAFALGGSTSVESYLDAAKILDASRRSGADAVHPGYGFLSENADFARSCASAGVLFVGPSPESIYDMGIKDRAKSIAVAAGVPVLPDAKITGETPEAWLRAGADLGYPLLVKATAGGGGKGMRLVGSAAELVEAVTSARREAESAFGNGAVFLERYLAAARHVEIQVFGDAHGQAVHLGERECSIQRRHQKVLEEAPSPVVGPQLRERMGATAVALVRELGYLGAGTVEYLLDDRSGEFFFLEMNTRLQVEHPVTEEVTGVDLVRLQLQVAQGEPLGLRQEDIVARGHAIEVRLYAEDPARDYLPTPGPLHRYHHPESLPGVRFEDGVSAPGDVSSFYDPMLAKVIAHAATRAEAAARLAAALDGLQVHGTITNCTFLAAILRTPDFLAGETRTDFLDRHRALGTVDRDGPDSVRLIHLVAAVSVTAASRRAAAAATKHAPPGFRLLPRSPLTRASWVGPDGAAIELGYRLAAASGDTRIALTVDGAAYEFGLLDLGPGGVTVVRDGLEHRCVVATYADESVWVNSPLAQTNWQTVRALPELDAASELIGPVAELPGTVVAVLVAAGERVSAGQRLIVLEAMKMEHSAFAPVDSIVDAVQVEVGQYVDAKTVLVALTPVAEQDAA